MIKEVFPLLSNIPSVIITGASGGIGRAMASRFAGEGYRLFLQGFRQMEALRAFADDLAARSKVPVHVLQADLADYPSVVRMFEEILAVDPAPDVLINNAGTACFGLLQDMSEADYDRVMDTNMKSVFACCRQVLPSMLHRHGGVILNISSIWGSAGSSAEVLYSASKGAVDAFTKALGKELAPSGIRVNAIVCGVIDTPMNDVLSSADKEALAEQIPLGRFGRPEEIADLAWYLSGPGSSYITGQLIRADGAFL
ncbi:MAG: SDR family oxidoreductase [Firmicutes bacterium]|nr:SDR family oxidoreductase [Bacillota bacterium]